MLMPSCLIAGPNPRGGEVSWVLRGETAADSPVPLEGTHWKLISLKGEVLPAAEGRQAPYLMLDAKEHRLSGFSGCNRMIGGYQLDGDHLTFGPVAGTMMACTTGMDVEQRFKAALSHVNRWKIDGQGLDLLDSDGAVVAHFEAGAADEEKPQ